MKIAAQLLAPYGRYLASVRPSQVDLVMSSHGGGHKASRSKDQGLPSKFTPSMQVIGRIFNCEGMRRHSLLSGERKDPPIYYGGLEGRPVNRPRGVSGL
jgi:hypothetical protein